MVVCAAFRFIFAHRPPTSSFALSSFRPPPRTPCPQPFKDNFWSTSLQPGSSVGNSQELSPALHEAISVFSAGPVTPGDGVGFSDAALIMRSCTTGGRLLQPSRAATAIDAAIVFRAFGGATRPNGEVYATYSTVSGWAWDHVLASTVNTSYSLTPADLAPIKADIVTRGAAAVAAGPAPTRLRLHSPAAAAAAYTKPGDAGMVAYSIDATTFAPASLVVQPFSQASPVTIKACGETDFQVWHTAPVFANGVAVLGELTKYVPMAEARVRAVGVDGATVTVAVAGEEGEVVPVSFWTQAGGVVTVACTLLASGSAVATFPAATCA